MPVRKLKFSCSVLVAVWLISSLSHLGAHDSIAASYVVPHKEFVWQAYDPELHADLDAKKLNYLPGWYIGAGAGVTEVSPEGSSDGFYVDDSQDTGFKVFVGRRFFPHWSAEVSYVDTGDAGITNSNPSIAATLSDESISYRIPTVSGSYHLLGPTRKVDVYGRVGVSAILNSVTDDRIPYEKQTLLQLNVGAGLQWRFAPKWFLRLEYDAFDTDASYVGISIARYFGRHDEHRIIEPVAQPEPVVEEAEEPIVEEQEPIETFVPVAICEKFNGTIDDVRFEIDSAVILESSYPVLKEVARNLAQYTEVLIEIQAYTDSTGTESYNLGLSDRRAQSIKVFLVQEGISEDRLIVEGFGETLPKATNSTREGRAVNRRVEFKTIDTKQCE